MQSQSLIIGPPFLELFIFKASAKCQSALLSRTSSTNPQNFALIVEGADSMEIRDEDGRKNGYTFFSSQLSEQQIQLLQQETEKQMQAMK